jgi:glycosyltransferase involved in cell wall biosynthesis
MSSFDKNLDKLRQLKIALVYDRVNTKYGGAEQVLKSLHELFPKAPLFTSVYDHKMATWAKDFTVISSFLQKIPSSKNHHRELLPLMPLAFNSFNFADYDIVISITSAEAKGISTSSETLHICYMLTPTRYLWSHHLEYETGKLALVKKLAFNLLRYWDFNAGQKPDVIIPISGLVQQRIKKYYQRQSASPIYPPFLKSNFSKPNQLSDDLRIFVNQNKRFLLIVSRLVPYKNVDLAIQACQITTTPLLILGTGPDQKRIKEMIGNTQFIKLIPGVKTSELHTIFQCSSGLILLAEEDFGITALEAQSFGKPVIVNRHSGAAETVINGETGIHVNIQNPLKIAQAIKEVKINAWNTLVIKQNADQYNNSVFQERFVETVWSLWKNKK